MRISFVLKVFFIAIAIVSLVVVILSSIYSQFWLGDLVNNYRFQLISLVMFSAVMTFFCFRWFLSGLVLVCIFFFVIYIAVHPLIFSRHKYKSNPIFNITTYNVNTTNKDYKAIRHEILLENPDILALVEARKQLISFLNTLSVVYPFHFADNGHLNDHIVIFSKLPLVHPHVVNLLFKNRKNLAVVCNIYLAGKLFTIIAVHLTNPMIKKNFYYRFYEYQALINLISQQVNPIILVGDFNTTTWSYYMNKLVLLSNLERFVGQLHFFPTWYLFSRVVSLPIDHILYSKSSIKRLRITRGHRAGSDHYPINLIFTVT